MLPYLSTHGFQFLQLVTLSVAFMVPKYRSGLILIPFLRTSPVDTPLFSSDFYVTPVYGPGPCTDIIVAPVTALAVTPKKVTSLSVIPKKVTSLSTIPRKIKALQVYRHPSVTPWWWKELPKEKESYSADNSVEVKQHEEPPVSIFRRFILR
jgi:hypothetical protein